MLTLVSDNPRPILAAELRRTRMRNELVIAQREVARALMHLEPDVPLGRMGAAGAHAEEAIRRLNRAMGREPDEAA